MDPGPLFLALDQGGSASRALVFNAQGHALASARVDVADHRPRPGWVEQDPETVIDSLRQTAGAALLQLDPTQREQVLACGLSCQRSSLVCWDRHTGVALSPILSWQDTRAAEWLVTQALDSEAIHASTGLFPNAHFGLSKIHWCLHHSEDVSQAASDGRLLVGPLAAFLAFRLLEQRPCLVDPANASRTLLFDLAGGDWSQPLLERFGIHRRWLPDIARSDFDYGDLALPAMRLPMRLLSGDQSTAAFAHGELLSDTAYLNIGTGAFVFRLAPELPATSRLLRSVIHWDVAPQYVVEGTVNGAGSALAWFGQEHGLVDVAARLDQEWSDDGPGDTLFLNGIGGLGAPDWRPDFASRFIGQATLEQQLVAVAESIVFLVQRNLDLLQQIGSPCTSVLISGGISQSNHFCQALSDLSKLPLRRPGQCEASARGSAFLLAGRPTDWAHLPEDRFEPRANPALSVRYARWSEAMALALVS